MLFATLPAHMGGRDFASSYASLVDLIAPSNTSVHVVDLGCGSGHLLQLLHEQGAHLRLTGVDFSIAEIAVARGSLPTDVRLLAEPAQSMSIPDQDVDCVLSHLALMVMHDLPQVFAEIHRILKPGGRLGAVIGRRMLLGEAHLAYREVIGRHAGSGLTALAAEETRSLDGWRMLLDPFFESVQFDDLDLPWRPTPSELCEALRYTYDIDRLPVASLPQIMAELDEAFAGLVDGEGRLTTGWGLRRIAARSRNASGAS
ncbi:MAG: class I SAM-dependent methyltransferase [Burkholderiales bacterium]|nr:class I SAM-dependent methyltransferase [Burkholderiales bacterium]